MTEKKTFRDLLGGYWESRKMDAQGRWVLNDSEFMELLVKACGKHFEARSFLSMGGEAILLLVWDVYLKVFRVLKIPRPDLQDITRQRFFRSARTLAGLENGHFPRVMYLSISPFFLVLDWTVGETLRDWRFSSKFHLDAFIDYFREILTGMAKLHTGEEGPITHRDLRPDNILITKKGGVKIIDFGLSKTKESKQLTAIECLGNECYSPPEQLTDAPNVDDPTADVYSLAQTFYFGVTSREEKTGSHDPDIFRKYDLNEKICDWYAKAISINPADRFPSAVEMLAEYNRIFPPPLPSNIGSEGEDIYTLLEDIMVILGGDIYFAEIFTSWFLAPAQLRRLWRAVSERRAKCILE